jgi:hypothetical protein
MAMCLAAKLFVLIGCLAEVAQSGAFLGRGEDQNVQSALSSESEHELLVELESALGSGHRHATEKRLKRLEQLLLPMVRSMSKDANGRLGSAATGYVLHRVFVQRHGWFIRALEPTGNSMAAWNSSSPVSIVEGRVPEHVQSIFENHLGEKGMSVKELAILAATLEHLVHLEQLQRLEKAYLALDFSMEDAVSEDEAAEIVDMYMSLYIVSYLWHNISTITPNIAHQMHAATLKIFPSYPETQVFLRETQESVVPNRDFLYFSEVEHIIAEVGERYGRFNNKKCQLFKDWLMEVEDPSVGGAGRVRISDFYGRALNDGKWQFSESVDYLRRLGALDESDVSNPRVIIPNYISGQSNCLASNKYYSVCCLDECESIMGSLEEQIAAPEAAAATIIRLVSGIPSSTMPSNRTLAPWLHDRLDEIAKHHGGKVTLHGRLFAQWLHYAYPRECSFPHIEGTISPHRPEDIYHGNVTEYETSTNETVCERVIAEAAPVKRRIPGVDAEAREESPMWSMQEELVVWREAEEELQASVLMTCRSVAMVGALLSLSVALVRSFQSGRGKSVGVSGKVL